MPNLTRTYLSLGSNQGLRLQHMQNAIDILSKEAGNVISISKVYQTPAWGFQGEDFLNACIGLETVLQPHDLLQLIHKTEERLGRVRTDAVGYQSRTIDLDILFYGEETIDDSFLTIPHALLQERLFVIKPLQDICANKVHPILKKTVQQLVAVCKDESQITVYDSHLKYPVNSKSFFKYNYLTIEGNIGAGKTTLTKKIAADFNAKLILESFAENPFLPRFYQDPEYYAFPLEMSFMAERYQQISEDLAQFDLFKDFVISDYHVIKSLIFAKITLGEDEFTLYRKFFDIMYRELPKPDLYVYLSQSTGQLMRNIRKRGRSYEQDIQAEYLEQIHRGYLDFIKTQKGIKVLVLDVRGKDFVNNQADYEWVVDQILNC